LERRVHERTSELSLITEITSAFIAYIDRDLRYRSVNRAFQNIFGVGSEDVVGKHMGEVLGDRYIVKERVARVLAGETVQFEPVAPLVSGERYLSVIYTPDREESGKVRGFVVMGVDITERKQAEGALRESEERFRLMADSAPVLVWLADTTKHCTWFNRAWLEFTGRTIDEEYGYGWASGVHPDDLMRCGETYNSAFDRREPFQMDYRLRRYDGEYRWVVDQGIPLTGPAGTFTGYIGSCIDITDRKRVERRDAFLVQLDDVVRPLTDPHEITQTSARMLGEHLEVNRCAYADVEADEDTFNLTGDYNNGVPSIVGRYTFTQFGAECLRLMRAGDPYIVNDSEIDPRTSDVRESYRLTLIRSVICLPLLKQGRFVAAMAVHQTEPRQWRADEVELLQLVANRCWESIERARVTRELESREEQFRTLVEQVRDHAIFRTDTEGRPLTWNEGVLRVLGFEEHEFLGQDIVPIIFTPEDIASGAAAHESEEAARTGRASDDRWMRKKDGTRIWISGMTYGVYDTTGTVVGYGKVMRDETERMLAAEAVRESEEQFRTLANTIPNLAWMAHPDGNIFWYNRRWYDYTGTTLAEVEGTGWQGVHDQQVLPLVHERWTASLETGEPFDMTFPIRGADGVFRPFLTRVEPVKDQSGKVTRWFGTNTDVATQQEAERRLGAAVMGSPFPIMLHAEDGEVIALSRSWTDLTGYAVEEIPTHQAWFRLAYPDRYDDVLEEIAKEFSSPHVIHVGEYAIRTKSGATRIWDFQVVPLGKLPDGRRLQMSAAVDVSERKAAEEAQKTIERQLMLLVEASATLLASPHSAQVLGTIIELAQRFVAADAYSVWRLNEDDFWRLTSSAGLSDEYVRTGMINAVGGMPNGPMVLEDITEEPLLAKRHESLIREGVRSMLVIPLHIHGEASGTVVFYWKTRHRMLEPEIRIATALGNLAASALGTAELYDRQSKLRSEAEAAERRVSFLAEAGAVLASSLEYQTTLASVAKLAVPSFADWAAVDIVNDKGEVERVAVEHSEPEKVRLAYELAKRYPPHENDFARVALRKGKSVLIERIPDELLEERAHNAEHLHLIHQLGPKSFIVAPIVVSGRSLGIISFVTAESGRHYTAADLQTADELARRAATAIEHARLYRESRESEERFRQLAENIREVFYITDQREGKTLFVSPAYEELWGRSAQTLHDDPRSFLDGVHPEDRPAASASMGRQIAGEATEDEYRVVRPDGSVRWVWDRAFPIRDESGDVYRIAGIAEDVTERKLAAEERLCLLAREKEARQTAELLNRIGLVLAAELNPERLIQSVTDVATRLTGAAFGALFYNTADEQGEPFMLYALSGASRADFDKFPMVRHTPVFAPTFRDRQTVRSDDILADPRYGQNPPYRGMPEGHLPVRSYLAVPVISRSGPVLGALLFGHEDVGVFTERHEQLIVGIAAQAAIALDNARLFSESEGGKQALQRSNEGLRRANADLEQFAYSASHDLKEPLRMVAIYSQMLQRKYHQSLDNQADEYLSYMVQGAQRMDMLVRDLLEYTQAVTLTEVGTTEPVDASAVLQQALINLKGAITESSASVSAPTNLPRILVRDAHLLQLFQNMIGNAIKYRAHAPPQVTVTADRDGLMWRLCIHDNGIGIAPQYVDQVFGIFRRLHAADKYTGTGIGLAICQKIVTRYGGRIWAESKGEGKGTTFCFTLPGEATT
jgi:PAS domain S-box-containing protein